MTMIPTTGIIMTHTDVTMKIGNCFMTMKGTIIIMTVNAATQQAFFVEFVLIQD